jgi:hypothetical protein
MKRLAGFTILAAVAALGVPRADAPNTLSPEEKAAGFVLLFDGTTTNGWHVYNKATAPTGWAARDGALTRVAEGGDISSDKEYANFDFRFDWKIAPKGNSGVMFHVVESPKYAASFYTGPEFQLLDNLGHPDGRNGKDRWAGANYALHAPSQDTTRPVGEWNQCRLVVNGSRVEHWMNGVKVVEYELWSDDWKMRVAASKFKQWPDYGMAKTGHIVLQDHESEVAFRNLRIKAL